MNPFKQSLKQLQQQQQWLAVFIFALVAIIIWVGVSLVTSQKKSGISAELKALAEPLTPSIDSQVLDRLEGRQFIPAEELQDFPIYTIYRDPKTRTEVIILKGQEAEFRAALDENEAPAVVEETPPAAESGVVQPALVPPTSPDQNTDSSAAAQLESGTTP